MYIWQAKERNILRDSTGIFTVKGWLKLLKINIFECVKPQKMGEISNESFSSFFLLRRSWKIKN